MMYYLSLFGVLFVSISVVSTLINVAYVTVTERKTMASMQRRLGPNAVGPVGLLQAFADALKLLLKEYVSPTQANPALFFIGPVITLIFSLLGYAIVPYSSGVTILDFGLSILYVLAVSSLATYGILLAGWSANSKYAFLGSLRSTAQLISYELILSSAILLVVLLAGSLSIIVVVEAQKYIWYLLPLFTIFVIFLIGAVAETNRAPFDLAEAESELVSGFMTEHAAVIFVFFFLAEYGSIVLICIQTSLLFLGGYLYIISYENLESNLDSIITSLMYIGLEPLDETWENDLKTEAYNINTEYSEYLMHFSRWAENSLFEGLKHTLSSALKACAIIFYFIWLRASFPRIRYDQLMLYCWTLLLPLLIGIIIIMPVLQYVVKTIPVDFTLLIFPFITTKKYITLFRAK